MKALKNLYLLFLAIAVTSCDNNQSLQEYYVNNQQNKNFVAVDIPASLLAGTESLTEEQRQVLKTVKKINLLAIPKKNENLETIAAEKQKIASILKDEKYQLLMRFGSGETRMELYFTGKEEAIDEIIVYGFNDNRGLGIARILGNDMNPGEIMGLMESLKAENLNLDGLQSVTSMFIEETESQTEE